MMLNPLTQKIRLMAFIVFILCMTLPYTPYAEAKQSQKKFTAITTGTKSITDAFSPKIKKEAEKMALRSAVERAVAEMLSAEMFASNLEILNDKILSNPSKYIINYSVIAELKQETQYVAAVKTRIDLTLLKKYLKRYGIIKSKKEKPAVLLMISEKTDQNILPQYWWSKNPLPYKSLAAEEIIRFMLSKEFIIKGDDTQKYDLEQSGIVFGSIYDSSAAIKLGKQLKVDIVVMGKVNSFETLNRMGEEKTYEANIVLDMFHVPTKIKIESLELKAISKNYNKEDGNKEALKKIGTRAGEEISKEAEKYWADNVLKKVQTIETKIEGEDYLSSFIQLRKALNSMQGVQSVQTKELGAGKAIVSILFQGNAEKLAQSLLSETFNSFGIEIYDVKSKSFTIKFVSK